SRCPATDHRTGARASPGHAVHQPGGGRRHSVRRPGEGLRDTRGAGESACRLGRKRRRIAPCHRHAGTTADSHRNAVDVDRGRTGDPELTMKTRLVLIGSLLLSGALCFGDGIWIYAKAQLAQFLLERAWARTLHGERDVKPWNWADTS